MAQGTDGWLYPSAAVLSVNAFKTIWPRKRRAADAADLDSTAQVRVPFITQMLGMRLKHLTRFWLRRVFDKSATALETKPCKRFTLKTGSRIRGRFNLRGNAGGATLVGVIISRSSFQCNRFSWKVQEIAIAA